jgi:hypoxanthine phosphoribosyltransferase
MSHEVAVLHTEEEIARRVTQLGAELTRAFPAGEGCVLGLMKGSLVFLADLVRRLPPELSLHLVRTSSHRERNAGRVLTEIAYSHGAPLEDRDVLLVVDIVDTGITLSYLLGHIHEHSPRSLRVCALIDKPEARKIDVHPDWSAFEVGADPSRFLVGYGLGWMERYRGLPFIGTIPLPDNSLAEGR